MAEVRLEDIKPNSHKSKEQASQKQSAPKVTPVVSKSEVVSTKKSLGQKFADTFIKEDVKDVKAWLVTEVIIPGVKDTILDMLSMMFFGGGSGYRRGRSYNSYNRENVSYSSYYQSSYNNRRSDRVKERAPVANANVDYRNIILDRRDSAERVIDEMCHRIDEYGQVSIAEMLDLMEISGKYTDNNWGWTDKRDIGLKHVANGWLIDVAEARLLD